MRRNKLYTVNKWNRPAFMGDRTHQNIFDGYLNSRLTPQQMANLKAFNLSANMTPSLSSGAGLSSLGNVGGVASLSETDPTKFFGLDAAGAATGGAGKGLLSSIGSGLGSMGLGMVGGVANKALSSLIGGDLHSGVGDAIGSIGNTVGSMVSNIPGVGTLAGTAVQTITGAVGGAVNRLWGSKLNEKKIAEIEEKQKKKAEENNALYGAKDTAGLTELAGNLSAANNFTKGDIGEEGVFSDEVSEKFRQLKAEEERLGKLQELALANATDNVNENNFLTSARNFVYGLGGPLFATGGHLFGGGGDSNATNNNQGIADIKDDIRDFYTQDFIARRQKYHPEETAEQVASVLDSSKMSFRPLGGTTVGGYDPVTDEIYIDPKSPGWAQRNVAAHEIRHQMAEKLGGLTPEENQILHDAYKLKGSKGYRHIEDEYEAFNTQLRNNISQNNKGVLGEELDKVIDNMDDGTLLLNASTISGYFNPEEATAEWLRKSHKNDKTWEKAKAKRKQKADAIRRALKEVAYIPQNNNFENMAAYGGNLFEIGGDMLSPLMTNVDTRSDTTRQGYNERPIPQGASRWAGNSPLTDLYNAVEDVSSTTKNNPYIQTGIAPLPSKSAGNLIGNIKNALMPKSTVGKAGLAKRVATFDNNSYGHGGILFADGGLQSAFMDEFGSDPIGAAMRYKQGLERQAAEEEEAAINAAREAEYLANQQRLANLETQYQGLQALMAAMPTVNTSSYSEEAPESSSPSRAAYKPSGNKNWDYIEDRLRKSGKFNETQIKGIKYNLQRESSINPDIEGDDGAAFGLAQWHGSRQPKDRSLEGQTKHLIETLSKFDGKEHWIGRENYEGFLNARTPEEAHYYITKGYERPHKDIVAKGKRDSDMSLRNLRAFGGNIRRNYSVGDVIDVTEEQAKQLKALGYGYEIIS